MNRFKTGEKLYQDMGTALANAKFHRDETQPAWTRKKPNHKVEEKKYLEEMISKAKSRLEQINKGVVAKNSRPREW